MKSSRAMGEGQGGGELQELSTLVCSRSAAKEEKGGVGRLENDKEKT